MIRECRKSRKTRSQGPQRSVALEEVEKKEEEEEMCTYFYSEQ